MGSGLEIFPPSHSGAAASFLGMIKRVHVEGKYVDVHYPRGEFEFSHGEIVMGVVS